MAGERRRRFSAARNLILSPTRLPGHLVSEKYALSAAKKGSEQPLAHSHYWAGFAFSGA